MRKLASLGLIVLGITIGLLGATAATRASRNPGTLLYSLRGRFGAAPQDTSEANWLQRHYGPGKHSTYLEEWIIRDFFQDKKQGVFVDVGSADYENASNTYFLEDTLGWSGIAIDAQESYRAGYEKHRPRTKFFALFVSDHSNDTAKLFLANGPGASSSTRDFSAAYGGVKGSVDVPTVTLNDLLTAQGVAAFDFLSMDIELAEPQGLAGLDIQRFHPTLAVVEAHPEVRQRILDYFAANHYGVVGKYLRVDPVNLWFMPLGSSVTPFPPERKAEEWQK
jgi:methyltransferase FkbM-like protein